MSENAFPQFANLPAVAADLYKKALHQAQLGKGDEAECTPGSSLQAFKDLSAMFVAAQKYFTQGLADGVSVSELSIRVGVEGTLSQFEEAYHLLKFTEATVDETAVLKRVCLRNLTVCFELWAADFGFAVIQRRPLLHAGYFEMALVPLAPAGN